VWVGEQGLVLDNAVAELRLGLARIGIEAEDADNKGTLVGTIASLNNSFGFALPSQKPEGFIITMRGDQLIIAGEDERGVLYGVYRLLLGRNSFAKNGALSTLFITDAPQTSIRAINHWDNSDGTIERGYAGPSLFFQKNRISYDRARVRDYARLLASVGINRLSLNNSNVHGEATRLITEDHLPDVAALAALFRPFNIRLMLSVNCAAPLSFGDVESADPLDPAVLAWWKERADLVYRYIPDLAGFLVKADSESEYGPFHYGRTPVDGANMLAEALAPHGGDVFWRCCVYTCAQDWRDHSSDRAKATYDYFMPFDGLFADNVVLQIKHGPYDFQVREPVSPLFGALSKTRHLMELQITQEYTGHQIDLCYLPWMWADLMSFDTAYGENSTVHELLGTRIEGLAAVANTGLDANWTGHTLAQANLFGYGRLAWNPSLTAREIAEEWSALTFGGAVGRSVTTLLLDSYPAYEKYTAPFGICFMVEPQGHYGPNVEGNEFSQGGAYHRASFRTIGIDRTRHGTGFTDQYAPRNAVLFADKATCPENLLLFFHRTSYLFRMRNGKTLFQNIYNTHFEGYEEVLAMLERWISLKEQLPAGVYESVKARLEKQVINARDWRDQINTYFCRRIGMGDDKERKIYD
jgi:alpha-glucuronidase